MSFVLVSLLPAQTLLFAPLVLGIPHVAGDLYLLLARERRINRWALGATLLTSLTIVLNAISPLLLSGTKPIDDALLIALLLALPIALMALEKCVSIATFCAFALAGIVLLWPNGAMSIMAYLHNFVALVFLFSNCDKDSSAKRRALAVWLALLILGSGLAFVLGGFAFTSITDPSLETFWSLIPAPTHPWAAPLLFSFGYTQAIHLMIWAFLLPTAVLPNQRERVLWMVNLGLVAVALLGLGGALLRGSSSSFYPSLRSNYILLVSFHGWMELTWILLRLNATRTEGRRLKPRAVLSLAETGKINLMRRPASVVTQRCESAH